MALFYRRVKEVKEVKGVKGDLYYYPALRAPLLEKKGDF